MPRLPDWLLPTAIGAWLAFQLVTVLFLPGLADDHVLRAGAARFAGPMDAFSSLLVPPRPLQHLTFWLGLQCGDDGYVVQRLLNFTFLAVAIGIVAALARQAGLSWQAARLAALAFSLFPAGRAVWWPAAVSGPARTAAMLAAVWCFGRGTRAAGVLAVSALAFGLGTHQSAVLVPGLCVLWVSVRQPSLGAALEVGGKAVLRPTFVAMVLLVLGAMWFYTRVPDQHLADRPLASVVANATWTSAWWWPEWLRVWAVDSVRGEHGVPARALGGALLAAGGAFVVWWGWRGGALARFAVIACVVDLALPVWTAGWSLRYALPAAAFSAVAIAAVRVGSRASWLVVVLLGAWLWDSVHALGEFRAAAELSERLVLQAADVRRQTPAGLPVHVLDAPDVVGRERDIAVANWGFAEAVAALGASGEIRMVRTRPHRTSSASVEIDAAAAERLRRTGTVLEYDAASGAFAVWREGVRR